MGVESIWEEYAVSGEEEPMGNNQLFSLKCKHRKWEISLEGELSPGSEELL